MNNIRPELYVLATSTSIYKEQKAFDTMLDASAMAQVTSMIPRKVMSRTANIQQC